VVAEQRAAVCGGVILRYAHVRTLDIILGGLHGFESRVFGKSEYTCDSSIQRINKDLCTPRNAVIYRLILP
jgi:hypothetical protein